MAVEFVRADVRVPSDDKPEAAGAEWRFFTFMASSQEGGWSSLCLELGLSSTGSTADEAIDRLVEVVADALAHEYEELSPEGMSVSEAELDEWLSGAISAEPVVTRVQALPVAGAASR
jgi:hypothetical protein